MAAPGPGKIVFDEVGTARALNRARREHEAERARTARWDAGAAARDEAARARAAAAWAAQEARELAWRAQKYEAIARATCPEFYE